MSLRVYEKQHLQLRQVQVSPRSGKMKEELPPTEGSAGVLLLDYMLTKF